MEHLSWWLMGGSIWIALIAGFLFGALWAGGEREDRGFLSVPIDPDILAEIEEREMREQAENVLYFPQIKRSV